MLATNPPCNGSGAVLHLSALCWNGAVLHLSTLCWNGSGTVLPLHVVGTALALVCPLSRTLNSAEISDWVGDRGFAFTLMQDSNGLDYAALERNVQKETLTEGERENNRAFSVSNKGGIHFSLHVGPAGGFGVETTFGFGNAEEKESARHQVDVRLIFTCRFEVYL
jgi:hypothetical protein